MAAYPGRRAGRGRPQSATPWRWARSASATRWRSLAWTPPGPTSVMAWRTPRAAFARVHRGVGTPAARSNDPSAIAASIRGRSWRTGRACAEVQMTDFGVAHLARRQADGLLGRLEHAVRPALEQAPPGRHGRGGDGVASRIAADAEPVEHDQDDGSRSARRHPARPRARAVIPARADDAGHLVGLERGSTDQRPVDRRLGEELADVRRGDAAAVQDRRLGGARPPTRSHRGLPGSHRSSPPRRGPMRCGRCRSPRRARRRSRGRRRERAPGSMPASEPRICVSTTSFARPASRSASCSPTQTIGRSPASRARAIFLAIKCVVLAGVPPPLGVADDDPRREAYEHRRGDLPGERAGQLVMHVLGADSDVGRRPPARRERRQDRRRAGR